MSVTVFLGSVRPTGAPEPQAEHVRLSRVPVPGECLSLSIGGHRHEIFRVDAVVHYQTDLVYIDGKPCDASIGLEYVGSDPMAALRSKAVA